jgi:HTH-type transcriptional regulator / antitoxin HipB
MGEILMDYMKKISLMVKEHRKATGLSQLDLANIAGVGKTTIFDIEKGKETIRFDNVVRVLEVLNIKIEFLSPYEGISNENN